MSKRIYLTKGKWCLVDDSDYDQLAQYKWRYTPYGYAARSVWVGGESRTRTIYMHRELLEPIPKDLQVDHISGRTLDNRRSNLRIVTRKQQQQNRPVHKKRSQRYTTIYKGVCLARESKNSWVAEITYNGIRIQLGSFRTEVEAAIAYNEAALKYHGEYARLNEITKPSGSLLLY